MAVLEVEAIAVNHSRMAMRVVQVAAGTQFILPDDLANLGVKKGDREDRPPRVCWL